MYIQYLLCSFVCMNKHTKVVLKSTIYLKYSQKGRVSIYLLHSASLLSPCQLFCLGLFPEGLNRFCAFSMLTVPYILPQFIFHYLSSLISMCSEFRMLKVKFKELIINLQHVCRSLHLKHLPYLLYLSL